MVPLFGSVSIKQEFKRVVIMRFIRLRLVKYPSSAVEILPKGGSKRLKSFHKKIPATNHRCSAIQLLDQFYYLPKLLDVLCDSQANARACTEIVSSITTPNRFFSYQGSESYNIYNGDGPIRPPVNTFSIQQFNWDYFKLSSAFLRKTHEC